MKLAVLDDVNKNLSGSVFYHPKLRKAYMLVTEAGFVMRPLAANEDGFNKKLAPVDTAKDFHVASLTSGFAPRLFNNRLLIAERQPQRQWHVGWTRHNTSFSTVYCRPDNNKIQHTYLDMDSNWYTRDGFLGNCWTGGFRTFKGILEDGLGALAPQLAVAGDKLLNLTEMIGYVKNGKVELLSDFYTSFLVRQLKDCGVEDISERKGD